MSRRNHTGHRVGAWHPRAKLPDAVVAQMRADYVPGVVGYGTLARRHGCGVSTARDIVKYWTRP